MHTFDQKTIMEINFLAENHKQQNHTLGHPLPISSPVEKWKQMEYEEVKKAKEKKERNKNMMQSIFLQGKNLDINIF